MSIYETVLNPYSTLTEIILTPCTVCLVCLQNGSPYLLAVGKNRRAGTLHQVLLTWGQVHETNGLRPNAANLATVSHRSGGGDPSKAAVSAAAAAPTRAGNPPHIGSHTAERQRDIIYKNFTVQETKARQMLCTAETFKIYKGLSRNFSFISKSSKVSNQQVRQRIHNWFKWKRS